MCPFVRLNPLCVCLFIRVVAKYSENFQISQQVGQLLAVRFAARRRSDGSLLLAQDEAPVVLPKTWRGRASLLGGGAKREEASIVGIPFAGILAQVPSNFGWM